MNEMPHARRPRMKRESFNFGHFTKTCERFGLLFKREGGGERGRTIYIYNNNDNNNHNNNDNNNNKTNNNNNNIYIYNMYIIIIYIYNNNI